MRLYTILAIFCIVSGGFAQTDYCQLSDDVDRIDASLFRIVTPSELEELKATDGLVIGDYYLAASAVQSFRRSTELAEGIRRIQVVDWTKQPFDRQNAELTIRQRMDDYLGTAMDFYDGRGKRTERQRDLTDTEIGDGQLSSALQSVKMAHVWKVPLDQRQVKKLGVAIEKRYAIAQSAVAPNLNLRIPEEELGVWDPVNANVNPVPWRVYSSNSDGSESTATLRHTVVGKRVCVEGIAWGYPVDTQIPKSRVVFEGGTVLVKGVDFNKHDVRGKLVRVVGTLQLDAMKPVGIRGSRQFPRYYSIDAESFEAIEIVSDPKVRLVKDQQGTRPAN